MKHFLYFISLTLLVSCSVQKRKYQKGFYVSRLHEKTIKTPVPDDQKKAGSHVTAEKQNTIHIISGFDSESASSGEINLRDLTKKNQLIAAEDTCDILLFKDGSEIRVKVFEVNSAEVKYKRCDNMEGPSYVTRKSDLFMIKYANGTRELIKAEAQVEKPLPVYKSYSPRKPRKTTHPLAPLALVFGILAVGLGFAGYMYILITLTVVPLTFFIVMALAALLAVILGKTAMNRIRDEPDVYRGKGLAIPGFVMGLVMLCIYALILSILFLIF